MRTRAFAAAVALFLLAGCQSGPPSVTARTPLQVFTDCRDCPEMVVVPAGRFTMGSAADEPGRDPSESPRRAVDVRAFALGRFDVTRAQWSAFATATQRPVATGCEWAGFPRSESAKASWRTLGFDQDDDHPVVCVSWNDAQDFARWLGARTGHRYRLPTEAEWEYAARAGSTTAYPWGAEAGHAFANYGADACCSALAEGRDRWLYTSPVGAFPPNAFGLFDMHGNAWQWTQDCFVASYAGAPVDGSAVDPPGCEKRVLRGGTWGDTPALIRSAFRNWAPPPRWNPAMEYRSGGVGFRVARVLE